MKILIIKKGEYDIWSMRMRQYICHTDHNLWDVIVNGDLEEEPAPTGETSALPAPKTAKQLAAKRNQERAAIKARFGGNEESKKMQKNVLKHQFENFTTASNESLDKAYDRVYEDEMKKSSSSTSTSQNLAFLSSENTSSTNEVSTASGDFGVSTAGGISQVSTTPCAHDRFIQKTGRNLDFKGKQHVTFDKSKVECYNCHKKGHFAKECKSGRNQGKRSYGDNGRRNATTNEPSSQALVAQDGLGGYDWSNDFDEPVNYALMAISFSSSSSSSDNEVQNYSKQCLESFKTFQKNFGSEREKHSKARLEILGYELALESLKSRFLGHEKNELGWGEKYEFQNYELKCRDVKIDNLKMELEKVVKERDELKVKIEKWEESSKGLNKILNSQMSTKDKSGLGYGTKLEEMSNKSKTDSEISMSILRSDQVIKKTYQQMIGLDEYAIGRKSLSQKQLILILKQVRLTTEERLQAIFATIDGHEKLITKASLRRHLKLEDAEGISSLSNEEIFKQLAQ
ncbi:ribonuclease H-like domain-containing protein [Tanacetum coccineum]